MIISHKLKVIFIKTKKVAGTSFEIALSKYCGDRDILTPISADDEQLRKDMGYICAQNYKKLHQPHNEVKFSNLFTNDIKEETFYNHMDALSIKKLIPSDIWDNYLKVSIVRDPCEVVLSRYFYDHAYNKDLLQQLPQSNMDIGAGQPISLPKGVSLLEKKINTPGLYQTFTRMNAKGNIRPQHANVNTMFTEELKAYVQKKARL